MPKSNVLENLSKERDRNLSVVRHISLAKSLKFKDLTVLAVMAMSAVMSMSVSANAQSPKQDAAQENQPQNVQTKSSTPISSGLQFNLPTNTANSNALGQNIEFPAIRLPNEVIGSSVFNLDVLDTACITGQGSCVAGGSRSDLGLTTLISTNPDKKLGISLRPRAALRVTDDGSSARVGGVVEFSSKRKSGSGLDNNTWYFFAGADAETVNYANGNAAELTRDGFTLQDRVFVGDAKAGLGYRVGGADLSLSYQRREATSDEFAYKEDAAALSFTWKR